LREACGKARQGAGSKSLAAFFIFNINVLHMGFKVFAGSAGSIAKLLISFAARVRQLSLYTTYIPRRLRRAREGKGKAETHERGHLTRQAKSLYVWNRHGLVSNACQQRKREMLNPSTIRLAIPP